MRRSIFLLGASVSFACPPEPAGECLNAADCNDDNACTVDSCDASECNNAPVTIDDQVSCTEDACDPISGAVSHTPQNNLCPSSDNVACTVDVCDVSNDCQNTSDDNLCNPNETCDLLNGCEGGVLSNPTINTVVPNNGLAIGAADILLTGDDLLPGATVTFGGVVASCTNVNTPTQLLCDVPPSSVGRVDVVVTNTDGESFTAANAFTNTGVTNELDQGQEFDFCVLQFPATTTTTAGQVSEFIFGRIFEGGLTDTAVGQAAPGVTAELGFGPNNSNPTQNSSWRFFSAAFNIETGINNNDDEYGAALTIGTAGTFLYTYRFSVDDGINFTYCDLNGAGSNGGLSFEANQLGTITVQ